MMLILSFWICLKFRRARLIECDILAGYPSENMILRREIPRRIMLRKGLPPPPRKQITDGRGIFFEKIPRRIMLRRGPYITRKNVRKFVEPDKNFPQNHALRNLVTKLSLHRHIGGGGNERKYIYSKWNQRAKRLTRHETTEFRRKIRSKISEWRWSLYVSILLSTVHIKYNLCAAINIHLFYFIFI